MAFRKKKALGQHFLKDSGTARKIAGELPPFGNSSVLEVGPGLGALTRELLQLDGIDLWLVETDEEAVKELREHFPELEGRIEKKDFLEMDLTDFPELIVTGNFPYSISSPLLVRMAEERDRVRKVVGMFQKEFADRIRALPGSKAYGRISVLVQAFFDAEKLFHLEPGAFSPAPKVRSSVIRLVRNDRKELPCDEAHFFRVVKSAFGQRRKTLRNALKGMIPEEGRSHPLFDQRAESLSVDAFIALTRYFEGKGSSPEG
jgi:16S rRNA (adenine1518-N6/adenine1519-N6)-dimethyltransferase